MVTAYIITDGCNRILIQNVIIFLCKTNILYHILLMRRLPERQKDKAILLLQQNGIARLSEFIHAGVTAATVSRMGKKGELLQLARGLYQLPDAELDANHSLAEAAKRVSKGIICLTTALAFHELTDTMPPRIWVAIGVKDRIPVGNGVALEIVRFGPKVLGAGIEEHQIEGVTVRIYSPAKTVVDLFRYRNRSGRHARRTPGLNLAVEGLRETLRQRKATPGDIARYAVEGGVWKIMQPYLEALVAHV